MHDPSIVDPFFRSMYKRLAEDLENRTEVLIKGSALTRNEAGFTDAETIALNYQKAVSYIEALHDVIALGLEMDRERFGIKKANDDE